MEKQEKLYCRFCAERKRTNKLFDLEKDSEKCVEIGQKLQLLNAVFVDVSNQNKLPKTVCFVCSDSLNKASDFIYKLKEAQSILANLFPKFQNQNPEISDDDISNGFDNLSSPELKNETGLHGAVQIKEEDLPLRKLKQSMENTSALNNLNVDTSNQSITPLYPVKLEPVEPIELTSESKTLADHTEPSDSRINNQNCETSIQALLDSTMTDLSLTLYAKEVPVSKKKSIKRWKDYPWACAQCNNNFSDLQMLQVHSKDVHKTCTTFSCSDCNDNLRCFDFEVFVKHARKHRKSLRNICHYCDQKTENLPKHLESHFLKAQTPCPTCGEILDNEEALLRHTSEYAAKKRKPRRKRGTPITMDDLTCKLCDRIYKTLNGLRDHKKLHTSDRKRNYTCDRCGKTFYNKGTLTTHIMSHDKIHPHICRICNKSFLFPNMLRRHVDMHSGVKPYSCEQCGRCFRLQYQLNSHKIIHTNMLPYICQYCSKAFRFKQILKNHERQHTGAKPYSCKLCSLEFTNWSNYNKHMKRRHNTDTSKKKITPEGVFPVNPETGQLIQIEDPIGTEVWKKQIMKPVKRGKKKMIKQEDAKS